MSVSEPFLTPSVLVGATQVPSGPQIALSQSVGPLHLAPGWCSAGHVGAQSGVVVPSPSVATATRPSNVVHAESVTKPRSPRRRGEISGSLMGRPNAAVPSSYVELARRQRVTERW